ncbi:hypothetical protein PQR62_04910 [Herbaspirillum lusitanum]|uniref:Uncharacterized protein n=1 Tax=Herbaspirillum lusitanum TaxID=213312 RepID=A0ABW9A5E7_9BURK
MKRLEFAAASISTSKHRHHVQEVFPDLIPYPDVSPAARQGLTDLPAASLPEAGAKTGGIRLR